MGLQQRRSTKPTEEPYSKFQTNLRSTRSQYPMASMACKAARKAIYIQKLQNHLKHNTHIITLAADNLSVKQTHAVRHELRSHSTVVMGNNTLMKRAIEIHAPSTGKPAFVGVIPHIVGKVGLILTSYDPEEVSDAVAGHHESLRPLVCSSMDIGMLSLWHWLLGFHLDLVGKTGSSV